MHIYTLFAHPHHTSFSRKMLHKFTKGLTDAGHTYEVNDLYASNFQSEMSLAEYEREMGNDPHAPLTKDVIAEHQKIAKADGLAFIYPLWWSDCPAKMKGWFDRVLTLGYAYFYSDEGEKGTHIAIKKAAVITSAGHSEEYLEEKGILPAMKKIMLEDRLLNIGVTSADLTVIGPVLPTDTDDKSDLLAEVYRLGISF